MTQTNIRELAKTAFLAGVTAADPAKALEKTLEREPLPLLDGGKYIIISVGKASCRMAEAAITALPEGADFSALAVTNYENVTEIEGCRVVGSAHPVPDSNGIQAANTVISMLEKASQDDLVLALISGGSSALLPAPAQGLTLHDKSQVNEVLLSNGFDIYQMNLVRQALSKLKGGGFLRYAHPANVQSYILSDVLGDDLRVVGSGPSVGPIGTIADARRLLIEAGLFTKMPETVRYYLEHEKPREEQDINPSATLVGGNLQSLAAMAQSINAEMIEAPLIGDVTDAADAILIEVQKRIGQGPFALAFGGETTVELIGTGKGGRNQELALHVAQKAKEANLQGEWCFLSGGTDGRDGPTDAAGGLVDGTTIDRIKDKDGDASAYLANNDSYHGLALVDDLLMTGATGTNVADLQLFIMS